MTLLAGLVAGAMSMAAGEYVSVSSQADTEKAELESTIEGLTSILDDEANETPPADSLGLAGVETTIIARARDALSAAGAALLFTANLSAILVLAVLAALRGAT